MQLNSRFIQIAIVNRIFKASWACFRIMHVSRSLDFTDIVPKPSPFTPDTGGQRRKGV